VRLISSFQLFSNQQPFEVVKKYSLFSRPYPWFTIYFFPQSSSKTAIIPNPILWRATVRSDERWDMYWRNKAVEKIVSWKTPAHICCSLSMENAMASTSTTKCLVLSENDRYHWSAPTQSGLELPEHLKRVESSKGLLVRAIGLMTGRLQHPSWEQARLRLWTNIGKPSNHPNPHGPCSGSGTNLRIVKKKLPCCLVAHASLKQLLAKTSTRETSL